ncbi:B12-binding domain-containing radical SAM protein [Sorangium sp. So ce1024]|uniref:B12-binding domain-containing radical SAM protein n=1 Tax=Sorangium sp. So ce1024 TaxID=3133327 RepID=UPI003F0995A2
MRIALVYPPTCDPTAPYLAVPMLTGFLRANGVEVLPVDANVEAFDALLSPDSMAGLRDRLEARLGELDRRPALPHADQLEYLALARARGDAHAVPAAIDNAKATLRSSDGFHDPDAYARAVATVEAALNVVSATHHPLKLDFTAYRTPFGLLSMDEIARSSRPEHDPFDGWVQQTLVPRLRDARADVVGLSVCFPGQLQPAYAFALKIKQALPGVHVTCGGPGVTQMLLRLSGERLARALGPFDSACLFEGEHTLLALARALDEGRPLRDVPNVVARDRLMGARWLSGHGMEDLKALPAPDFDGLPLHAYLAPALVLPYDPTRGCYWGKCTFCHYGLAEVGTAAYRERAVETIVAHLGALAARHGTRHFYLSQDSVAPKTLVKMAQAILDAGLDVRWATDLKPEKYLTQERADVLRRAGAVACALGVESASPRVLGLIDKGAPVEVVSDVIDHLASAGVAAEAMCFTDFPTETHAEAVATLDFLRARREALAVYIVGEFGLTHGSLVAQAPERFGIDEVFALEGDELGLGLFFVPREPWKTDAERADVDARLADLSRGWTLRSYPWAGAVSTAHTILQYDRFGPGVFRDRAARRPPEGVPGAEALERGLRFDPRAAEQAEAREAEIWATLVHEERRVGRDAYEALARSLPPLRPRPVRVRFVAGAAPAVTSGRRPSHATSSAR